VPYKNRTDKAQWQRRNRHRQAEYKASHERIAGGLKLRPGPRPLFTRKRTRNYSTLRNQALDILGGACARCGFRDRRALQIDHIVALKRKTNQLWEGFDAGRDLYCRIIRGNIQ
jgi:5-methylcytosine-specific restriction endonuclease McrA